MEIAIVSRRSNDSYNPIARELLSFCLKSIRFAQSCFGLT